MDVGTAKPSAAERTAVPHHLIDILDPAEPYSAARFALDACAAISQIRARGHVVLLVGGTMLYLRALTDGLNELPSADAALRAQLQQQAARDGWPALHAQLARIDPATAARLHPNDAQRIGRALEIVALSGVTPSAWYARPRAGALNEPVLRFALGPLDRAELHARIEARFDAMLSAGFVAEVAQLRARGDLHPGLPAMRAVGYRQIWESLDGSATLDQARARAIAATRQYAKRQLTWLRAEAGVEWLGKSAESAARRVIAALQQPGDGAHDKI
jgi:tRNA dimethylallyltransferase